MSFLFLIVVDHTPCSMVSSCRLGSNLVVMYSFLCSNAIPFPCLAALFSISILRLLLCRSLVSIHTLSSFMFFNQVSLNIMKSVFSSSLVSTICCCLFFIDLIFTVAILTLFELFSLVWAICTSFFCIYFFGLNRYLLLSWRIVVISGTVHWLYLKTSFHPLLWTSSGLTGSWKLSTYIRFGSLRSVKVLKLGVKEAWKSVKSVKPNGN